jgi:hypothetical protein
LRRAALAARLRPESHIAAKVAFKIKDVESLDSLAFPNAAFGVVLTVVKLKGLACLEVQVGIDAGYFVSQSGTGGKT